MNTHFIPVLPHHDHDEFAAFARLVTTADGTLDESTVCHAVVGYGRGYRVVGRFASQRDGLVATVNFGLMGSGLESTRRLDNISQLEAVLTGDIDFDDLPIGHVGGSAA